MVDRTDKFNPFEPSVVFHIETRARQMTGFYMEHNTGLKWVKQQLKVKHSEASQKFDALLLTGPVNEVHKIIFDDIAEEIKKYL